jgi:predicted DCC family thiol-disulfide oxidoreductase YuxK
MMGASHAVIYDGTCGVCARFIARLERLDRRKSLELIPSQGAGVHERFPWIPPAAFDESIQVVRIADGKTWANADALEELLNILPRGRWLSWIFSVPLVRGVANNFYRRFARNRYRFGCSEHCAVRK